MWPECVADFATAVDQSTLPHHSFKPREELRGQPVIACERLVIFGNKRFMHCDLFSRANQASLPVGEPERWRIEDVPFLVSTEVIESNVCAPCDCRNRRRIWDRKAKTKRLGVGKLAHAKRESAHSTRPPCSLR